MTLEGKLNGGKVKLLQAYAEAKIELKSAWKTIKLYYPTAAAAGAVCGIIARLGGVGSASSDGAGNYVALASATFMPMKFMGKLPDKMFDYSVIAISALDGYYAGYMLTDIVMKIFFPDQAPLPAQPPVTPTPHPRPRIPWPDTIVV